MRADILTLLDLERRALGEPSPQGQVVREHSPDGSECRVVYSRCTPDELDSVIRREKDLADAQGYSLEWKVYDHDDSTPALKERLLAAGFEPEPEESVVALSLSEAALAAFAAPAYDIRRIEDPPGLADFTAIARETGRTNVEEEQRCLGLILHDMPDRMSVYVAYLDGEPVACGRIHFLTNGDLADLSGGRTKTTHRNRGFYTALVAARLREAFDRNVKYVLVDALPTSEPILSKRGFQLVTHTQPFVYRPGL